MLNILNQCLGITSFMVCIFLMAVHIIQLRLMKQSKANNTNQCYMHTRRNCRLSEVCVLMKLCKILLMIVAIPFCHTIVSWSLIAAIVLLNL
jgi:hypothetical protein